MGEFPVRTSVPLQGHLRPMGDFTGLPPRLRGEFTGQPRRPKEFTGPPPRPPEFTGQPPRPTPTQTHRTAARKNIAWNMLAAKAWPMAHNVPSFQ